MAKQISPLTTKFLLKLHGFLDDPDLDLLVWVDDHTWMVTDKKEFLIHAKSLFGVSKGEGCWRKLKALGFVFNPGRGAGKKGVKQTVTVKCPDNFRRGQHDLCRSIRSVRTEASHKSGPKRVSVQDGETYRPCICQCCNYRGEDGRERVWSAGMMCDDCIGFWADLQSNGGAQAGSTEGLAKVEGFYIAHLAKTEHR